MKTITASLLTIMLTMTSPVKAQDAGMQDIAMKQALSEFKAGHYSTAQSLFEQQAKQDVNSPIVPLYLARIALSQERYDEAEDYIKEASSRLNNEVDNATRGAVYFWLGTIMEQQAENSSIFSTMSYAKKSLTGYLQAVKLLPDNLQYREGLINFYLDAPGLLGGNTDKAIKQAQIVFSKNELFGYKMLANCYAKNGDTDLMLSTYSEAMASYPSDAELFLMRGSYWKGEREYEKAVADYKIASELPVQTNQEKATRVMAWYWQGRIGGFSHHYLAQGIEAYRKVIRFKDDIGDAFLPSKEWTEFRLAQLLASNGEKKEANAIFVRLLETSEREDMKEEIREILD